MYYNEILVIAFLYTLYDQNLGYSSLNTARSTLSTFLINGFGNTIGASSLVKRFLKGVFELRPPCVRYQFIWDVNIVLEFSSHFHPNDELPLDLLSYKLVMLLALATKERIQTLHAINLKDIKMS